MNKNNESNELAMTSTMWSEVAMDFMRDNNEPFSDEEFYTLFNEARYSIDGAYLFFRKTKHIRSSM